MNSSLRGLREQQSKTGLRQQKCHTLTENNGHGNEGKAGAAMWMTLERGAVMVVVVVGGGGGWGCRGLAARVLRFVT